MPLGMSEIRILRLLPEQRYSASVECDMIKADIANLPAYSCLSYTWGDASNKTSIHIGGKTLPITASLDKALRTLRLPGSPLLLWVDQICINQQDVDEQSTQIPLMRDIYSLSTQTIGWLGEGTPDSAKAVRYLDTMGRRAKGLGLISISLANFQAMVSDDADLASGIMEIDENTRRMRRAVRIMAAEQGDFLSHPAQEGMLQLAQLPYFTRGWIQQEVAIPRVLTFQWGENTIDADIFAEGITFHIMYSLTNLHKLKDVMPTSLPVEELRRIEFIMTKGARVSENIHQSLVLRSWYHSNDTRSALSLANLLKKCGKLNFSVHGDRVHGVLGLANDIKELGILVDVSAAWTDTYTDVTRRVVQKQITDDGTRSGVNFLSFVQFPKSTDILPTWVPDFTRLGTLCTLADNTATLTTQYNASRGVQHTITNEQQEVVGPKALLCKGIIVDRVSRVGRLWLKNQHAIQDFADGLEPLFDIAEFAKESEAIVGSDHNSTHPFHSYPQRLSEATWRVPILNRESVSTTSTSRRATENSKKGYQEVKYMMGFNRCQSDLEKLISDLPLEPEESVGIRQFPEQQRDIEEIKLKIDKFSRCGASSDRNGYELHLDGLKIRVPYLGGAGYVGLGPPGMQVGDLICVVYGSSFPLILRGKTTLDHGPSGYQLVGECYCDAIMDGEALHIGQEDQLFMLI
jgi:hypothetical protein